MESISDSKDLSYETMDIYEKKLKRPYDEISNVSKNCIKNADQKTEPLISFAKKIKLLTNPIQNRDNEEEEEEYPLLEKNHLDFRTIRKFPTNLFELNNNLAEVINHYPRYHLNTDLSVIDTINNLFPKNWDPNEIRYKLKEIQKLLLEEPFLFEKDLILNNNIQIISDYLKPKIPVCLEIIIEKGIEIKKALLKFTKICLIRGRPTVITMGLYNSHQKKFDRLFKDSQIYYQQKGKAERLMLILPKVATADHLGFKIGGDSFNGNPLVKWRGKDASFPLNKEFNFNKNLQQIFLPEEEDRGFYRIVKATGHGRYAGSMVGLNPEGEFQEFVKVLKNHQTVFLGLTSCFLGGTNSTKIEEIPFPIFVESSMDVGAYTSALLSNSSINDEFAINLDKVKQFLFPLLSDKTQAYRSPKPISNAQISHCVNISSYYQVKGTFSNLGTIFQPTPPGVPKIANTISTANLTLDISQAVKKCKNLFGMLKNREVELIDQNEASIGYLFSEPINLIKLNIHVETQKSFLSRGGHFHHLISEIIADNQKIEDFGEATFNAFAKESNDNNYRNKAFFIAKMKCQYKGKVTELEQVVMSHLGKTRKIMFKVSGKKNFHEIIFIKEIIKKNEGSKILKWIPQEERMLPESLAIFQIYQIAADSNPSCEALLQVTAGKTSNQDFYEALIHQFWGDSPPFEAQLYHATVSDQLIFTRESGEEPLSAEQMRSGGLKQSSLSEELIETLYEREDADFLQRNMIVLNNMNN